MSNTDISKYSRVSKDILQTHDLLLFQLLVSQTAGVSKLIIWDQKRTSTLRYLELTVEDINILFSVYSVDNPLTEDHLNGGLL